MTTTETTTCPTCHGNRYNTRPGTFGGIEHITCYTCDGEGAITTNAAAQKQAADDSMQATIDRINEEKGFDSTLTARILRNG